MSKDRYGQDHTIQVVGGTQTLNVEDHLSVSDDLEIGGDITVVGTINTPTINISGGDLTLTGDLVVEESITVNNVEVIDTLRRDVAESVSFNFAASSFVPTGDWGAGFTHLVNSDGSTITVAAGEDLTAAHSLESLPNGCVIDNLHLRYTPNAGSGYTITARIHSRGKTLGNVATIATVSETSGNDGVFNVVSTLGIDETINTTLFSYWLIFTVSAPGGDSLQIHEVDVDCDIIDFS